MSAQSIKAALWVFVMGIFYAQLARTEPQKWTVVVVHSGNEKLAVRISAELSSLGYDVKQLTMPPPIVQETLSSLAQAYNATALMQVSPEGNAVQVWVVNRTADNVTELQEVEVPPENEQADALIAFKAVELLRASLMTLPENRPEPELELEPEPKQEPEPKPTQSGKSSVPPAPLPPQKVEPKEPRLFAALQPAAVFPFGGLKPSFNISLSVYIRLASRLGLDIAGLIPSFSQSVSVDQGTFDLLFGAITFGLRVKLLPPRFRVMPSISASAGPLLLRTRGHADPEFDNFNGEEALTVTALLGGALTLTYSVNEYFALRADAGLGAVVPNPVFEVSDTRVADFGRPLLTVLIGVEVRLL